MTRARLLLVTPDADLAARITTVLQAGGAAVRWERDSLAGLIAVETWQPALVLLDWALPFVRGAIFVHTLRVGLPAPPAVIALAAPAAETDARAAGVDAVLVQPVALERLVEQVRALVGERS